MIMEIRSGSQNMTYFQISVEVIHDFHMWLERWIEIRRSFSVFFLRYQISAQFPCSQGVLYSVNLDSVGFDVSLFLVRNV